MEAFGGIKNWLVNDRAVVAVEFAMVALPFLTLLIGTTEIALAYASSYMLEGGTVEAARLVRTGEAVDTGDPETAFKVQLCDQVSFMIPCDSIVYESIALDGFSSVSAFAPQFDADGNMISSGFDAGGSSDVILVRAFYRYEFLTPLIGGLVTEGGNGMGLLSTAVIRNEPYHFGG